MTLQDLLPRGLLLAVAAVFSAAFLAEPASAAAAADRNSLLKYKDLCANTIHRIEARSQIPPGLMQAIAMVESGRSDAITGARFAWPWTIHAEGRGRYFPSKTAAVSAVRKLQARGVSNIDVGCMQVNLHYHGDKFDSIEAALDPARNATYAARFLERLHGEEGSWSKAIGFYHSRTTKLNRPYRAKVYRAWRDRGGERAVAQAAFRPFTVTPRSHLRRMARPKHHLLSRARRLQASAAATHGPASRRAPTWGNARLQPERELLHRLRPANVRRLQKTAKGPSTLQGRTNPLTLDRPKTLRLYRQQGAVAKTYRKQIATAPRQ